MKQDPGLEEVVLVPLYPHYAMSSYETAVEYMKEVHKKNKYRFQLKTIKPYYNEPAYIHALAETMRPYLQKEFDHFLFSYHGVPERHIIKGDVTGQHCLRSENCCETDSPAHQKCYRHQCRVTTRLVAQKLNLPTDKYSISFQSRLGRSEWLKPYTAIRLEQLPSEGKKKILVACPAFVSDCLETLEEIAEQGKEIFLHNGGESFTMIPCLNDNIIWAKTIVEWITEIEAGNKRMLLSNLKLKT
jgi:ferrochelatase